MKSQLINMFAGGVGAMLLSAAARALPEPLPQGSRLYLFFYRFAQAMMANFDKTKVNSN